MDAMQILVIILSVFLAIFLVLAIILIIQLIRVTKQIRMIATTTQSAVERVSNIASTAGKIISLYGSHAKSDFIFIWNNSELDE